MLEDKLSARRGILQERSTSKKKSSIVPRLKKEFPAYNERSNSNNTYNTLSRKSDLKSTLFAPATTIGATETSITENLSGRHI